MKEKSHSNVMIVVQPFQCNICDASFSQKGDMNGHMESVYEGKKSFKCNVCETAFSEKSNLNGHIESERSLCNATSVIQAFLKKV